MKAEQLTQLPLCACSPELHYAAAIQLDADG